MEENGGDATLHQQLHKLPMTTTEETLARVLETLWRTRSTGVAANQKPALQSLLNLPSLRELDPVLACLRSIIRKTVRQDLSGDDIQKLFPLDLPVELQSNLVRLLQRYQNEWKDEASRDQPPWQHTRVSQQANANVPPALTPFPASEISSSIWPRIDNATCCYNNSCNGPTSAVDSNLPRMTSVPSHRDNGIPDGQMILPCLKSMTWTMENRNSAPANRVAVVSLKLQDYAISPLGEVEVKFQLSRDTLEAMLRSMTYISEKLSNSGVAASEPLAKKQRQ